MPVDMLNPVQARDLRVRMAKGETDMRAAQHLRWKVFCEELGATVASGAGELDVDPFDPACDHLLVEDMTSVTAVTVGTYRLLRHGVARTIGGFYSAGEFDLEPLLASADARTGELLELGRSCVLPAYRSSGTIQLLWRGIAHYLQQHRIAAMFGCASFSGTDPDAHAEALSYLHFNHLAPRETRVVAFLEQRIAYRIQELTWGGPSKPVARLLDALADEVEGKKVRKSVISDPRNPVIGTRLVREWDGAEHVITVLKDGFDWQGRRYKSLSAVARDITGTQWNGYRFFGLRERKDAA